MWLLDITWPSFNHDDKEASVVNWLY